MDMSKRRRETDDRITKDRKTGGRAKTACQIVGTAMIIVVILLCSLLVVPKVFGCQTYHVISGSMEPALKVGSLIYIQEGDPKEAEEDDIIVFYSSLEDRGIITHRVVKNNVVSGTFRTKGDANASEDPTPVPYDNYIGKVTLAIPYMGKMLMVLTSLYGKIAGVCIVTLGVILNLIGAHEREESGEE